jgi:hypothetical protein
VRVRDKIETTGYRRITFRDLLIRNTLHLDADDIRDARAAFQFPVGSQAAAPCFARLINDVGDLITHLTDQGAAPIATTLIVPNLQALLQSTSATSHQSTMMNDQQDGANHVVFKDQQPPGQEEMKEDDASQEQILFTVTLIQAPVKSDTAVKAAETKSTMKLMILMEMRPVARPVVPFGRRNHFSRLSYFWGGL